jgi:hypothetical protein
VSYLWSPPEAIEISLKAERLYAFKWKGRSHRVIHLAKDWRIDWGWWRLHIWRHYYKLVTDTGLLVLVYQDLADDSWYLQQVYD